MIDLFTEETLVLAAERALQPAVDDKPPSEAELTRWALRTLITSTLPEGSATSASTITGRSSIVYPRDSSPGSPTSSRRRRRCLHPSEPHPRGSRALGARLGCSVSPRASMATKSAMRLARVSGFFAVCTR